MSKKEVVPDVTPDESVPFSFYFLIGTMTIGTVIGIGYMIFG